LKQENRGTVKKIIRDRESFAKKEAAQILESIKLQAQIATELAPLISIDRERAKLILEKYRKNIESIVKEKSSRLPDQATEFEIQ
jgi:hypothetical protein